MVHSLEANSNIAGKLHEMLGTRRDTDARRLPTVYFSGVQAILWPKYHREIINRQEIINFQSLWSCIFTKAKGNHLKCLSIKHWQRRWADAFSSFVFVVIFYNLCFIPCFLRQVCFFPVVTYTRIFFNDHPCSRLNHRVLQVGGPVPSHWSAGLSAQCQIGRNSVTFRKKRCVWRRRNGVHASFFKQPTRVSLWDIGNISANMCWVANTPFALYFPPILLTLLEMRWK